MHARKAELEEYKKEQLITLINGKPEQFILSTIITDLCNKNYIKQGEYIVDVNW